MNALHTRLAAGLIAALTLAAGSAAAATIRVNCEVRADRARISVDGKDLAAGRYGTVAVSGGHMASSPLLSAVAGAVETDYDSNPADIRAGAVAIPGTFVSGGSVTGKVVDASGNTVIADTVACRVRSR